jgi:hypothetical protein
MKNLFLNVVFAAGWLMAVVSPAFGQYSNFVISNVGLNLGLSSSDGSWSYYLLNLSTSANGKVQGHGSRHDVGPGVSNVEPSNNISVVVDTNTSGFAGPIVTNSVTTGTFNRRITIGNNRSNVTLTNEQVAEAAFFAMRLLDTNGVEAGLLKGAHVYNYYRTQTVAVSSNRLVYGWKDDRRNSWYGGQVFGSFQDMTGSTFLGD